MNFSSILFFCLRLSKYSLWLVLVIGLVIGSMAMFYSFNVKSIPNGSVKSVDLRDKTTIAFDQSDVAHIEAKYPNDAYFALGYLHARERTWQMEFNRRLASGTLSEILGEKTIDIDRFIKTLGIRKAARNQFENLPSSTKLALEAYSAGVNAGYVDLGWALPIEFWLTGSKPGLWTPVDSVSWTLMMALDLGDNWGKEFNRLELAKNLPTTKIWEILPPYFGEEPVTSLDFAKMYHDAKIFPIKTTEVSQHKDLNSVDEFLPQNIEGKGSNNWVIAGSRTVSKKPLLANDPHLGLSSPSTWYFAHLKAKELNVIGGTIPGLPGVVLGYTPNIAWGFTNTAPDVQDLFIEAINPENPLQYKTPKGYESFKVRRESILVKGQENINFVVRETRHGPVISDAYAAAAKVIDTNRFVLALQWAALDPKNQSIRALIDMNKANSLETLRESLDSYYAPMQNIVMADTEGKIAFTVAGVTPKRMKNQGMVGAAPVFGWDASNDWQEFLKPQELPHQFAPEKPWVYTANQKVEDLTTPYTLTSDWTMPYRADRIHEMLEKNTAHDVASMQAMQNDTQSLAARPLLDLFKKSVNAVSSAQSLPKDILNFEGDMRIDSASALIFNAWVDQLTRAIFAEKLGESFNRLYSQKGLRDGLIVALKNNPQYWCKTSRSESLDCLNISKLALENALSYLTKRYGKNIERWQWGEAHIAIGNHRPFGQVPVLKNLFNIRTPSSGDGQTINVGKMNYNDSTEPYSSSVAPGMRAIYDLSDLNQSIFIGFGGQSGWVQSKRYQEYINDWREGRYLPLTINPQKFKDYHIELTPN
jgi:penicillin G amidase